MKNGFLKCSLLLSLSAVSLLANVDTNDSYAIGATSGGYVLKGLLDQKQLGVGYDADAVIKGFSDALKSELKLSDDEIAKLLNKRAESLDKIVKEKEVAKLKENLAQGKAYMEKNAKNKNVKTTKSNLQYEIIKGGSKGATPKPESIIIVNYKASFAGGKVFDETKEAPAHLSMLNLIPGLEEGLMLMKEGEKFKFVIPPELAYGDSGMEGIPGGETIVFEIELIKVLKPGELAEAARKIHEKEQNEGIKKPH